MWDYLCLRTAKRILGNTKNPARGVIAKGMGANSTIIANAIRGGNVGQVCKSIEQSWDVIVVSSVARLKLKLGMKGRAFL